MAQTAVSRAVAIDAQLAEAHLLLGDALLFHAWDWPAAEREFRRALKIKPNDAAHHAAYAMEYLIAQGHFTEGLAEIQKARSIRFVAPDDLAVVYLGLGARNLALDQLERARAEHCPSLIYLAVNPKFDRLKSEPRSIALLESLGLAACM